MLIKLCFLHVHKCAGSSIINLARSSERKLYPVEENGNPLFAGGAAFSVNSGAGLPYVETRCPSRIQFWKWPDVAQREFYSSMPADFVAIEAPLVRGLFKDKRLKYFTILREPIARSLSHYYQRLEDGMGHVSIEAYFNKAMPGTDSFMTRFFSGNELGELTPQDYERALAVLSQVDVVLFVDRLGDGLSQLNALGWSFTDKSLQRGGSSFSAFRPKIEDALLPLANEFNEWDIKLWNAVRGGELTIDDIPETKEGDVTGEDFKRAIQQNHLIHTDKSGKCAGDVASEALYFDRLNWEDFPMNSDHLLFLLKRALYEAEWRKGIQLFEVYSGLEGLRAVHFYYLRLLSEKSSYYDLALQMFGEQLDRFMGSAPFLRDYEAIATCSGNLDLALEVNGHRSSLFINENPNVGIDRYWLLSSKGDVEAAFLKHKELQALGVVQRYEERIFDLADLALNAGATGKALEVNRSIKDDRSLGLETQLFWIYCAHDNWVLAVYQSELVSALDSAGQFVSELTELAKVLYRFREYAQALHVNEKVLVGRSLSLDRQKYDILCELNQYARALAVCDVLSEQDSHWNRLEEIESMSQRITELDNAWSYLENIVSGAEHSDSENLLISVSCVLIGKPKLTVDAYCRGVGYDAGAPERIRLRRQLISLLKKHGHYWSAFRMFCSR